MYSPHFTSYKGADLEALLHHADPHPKVLLRKQAYKEMTEECTNVDDYSLWVKSVLWKLKKNEWAKPGKKPRSIGDLGVAASLLGFRLTNFMKTAQAAEDIEVNGGTICFCKSPDPFELKKHFENLLDPPGRFYYLYFSDDACLAIRNPNGGVDRYNLDISSCDASHSTELFRLLERLTPRGLPRDDMERLVAQCKLPLRVVSRVDPNVKIVLQPLTERLYSGSTITTAINNCANICIGLAISQLDYTGVLGPDGSSFELINAAAQAGYIVTGTNPLTHFEDVQFLKNSPVLDNHGDWHPMLNFGVFLRSSGTCNGDLPGHGPLKERAEAFQRGLLKCTFPYCTSEVIDRMHAVLGTGNVVVTKEVEESLAYKTVLNSKYPIYQVDTVSFCRRYRLDDSEYSDLLHEFANLRFGQHYNASCVAKILKKDYDLTTTELDTNKYLLNEYNSDRTEASF